MTADHRDIMKSGHQGIELFAGAGLSAESVIAWRDSRPRFVSPCETSDTVAAAAHRLEEFSRRTGDLLARLPPKPRREPREADAAGLLNRELQQVRTDFLRAFAEAVYRSLTRDYAIFVRAESLVAAAGERFPGLVPSRESLARERDVALKDKEGLEVGQGIFFSQILSRRQPGLHLLHAMLRPTVGAEEALARFRAEGFLDVGPVRVAREGNVGHVTLRNEAYLNAEDDTTVPPMETAIDLVLLDPAVEIGVLRGGPVQHPKYRGRRVFNAGINLTHLYFGRISLVNFLLVRELGFVNKCYRGLSGAEFRPDEPETTLEKPWIAAVDAFAIGGGCQLLLTMDYVIAERGAYFSLPARKEGIIPGSANLRFERAVGARLSRQGILNEHVFDVASPDGSLLCDEVVESQEMDAAIDRVAERLTNAGAVSAAANRKALRAGQEPLDTFRQYMALYAREQAICQFSPALVRNLEANWDAKRRSVKG